jgi:hypothetical protein
MYENVASMQQEVKHKMSTYFMCEPIMVDAGYFTAQRRKHLFWGNDAQE